MVVTQPQSTRVEEPTLLCNQVDFHSLTALIGTAYENLARDLLGLFPNPRPSLFRRLRYRGSSRRRQYALFDATKGSLSDSFSRRKSKRKSNGKIRDGIE